MKKLLIALLMVASPAFAETDEWWEQPNAAGGRIILMNTPCKNDGKFVITTSPDGTSARGCWINRAEAVFIMWDDDTVSSFDQSTFTYKTRKLKGKGKK